MVIRVKKIEQSPVVFHCSIEMGFASLNHLLKEFFPAHFQGYEVADVDFLMGALNQEFEQERTVWLSWLNKIEELNKENPEEARSELDGYLSTSEIAVSEGNGNEDDATYAIRSVPVSHTYKDTEIIIAEAKRELSSIDVIRFLSRGIYVDYENKTPRIGFDFLTHYFWWRPPRIENKQTTPCLSPSDKFIFSVYERAFNFVKGFFNPRLQWFYTKKIIREVDTLLIMLKYPIAIGDKELQEEAKEYLRTNLVCLRDVMLVYLNACRRRIEKSRINKKEMEKQEILNASRL